MKKHKKVIAGILALVFLLYALPAHAEERSSSEIREQIDALEEKEAEIQSEMDELEGKISDNLSELEEIVEQKKLLDRQVTLLHEQIKNTNDQISAYGVLIADKQDELDDAMERYQELSDKHRERVRAMEEEGSLSYWSVLFKANSLADLLDRLNMIEEIAASDNQRLVALNEAAQVVADAQAALEGEKDALEQTKADLLLTQEALAVKQDEANSLMDELRARGEEFELYMAEAEERQKQIMEEIAEMEDAYDEAKYQEWLATSVPPTYYPGDVETPNTSPPNAEGFVNPLDSMIVTSPFGMRIHPIYGDWRMHEGVDLAGDYGTPIYAIKGGVVALASSNSSAGNFVTIDHGDGFRSISMHMTHYIVSTGQYVSAGQVIGYMGSTGDSTGPHLHLGILYNGYYVNPMLYVG